MSSIPDDIEKYAPRLLEIMKKQFEEGRYSIFPREIGGKAPQEKFITKMSIFLSNKQLFEQFIDKLKVACLAFIDAQNDPTIEAAGNPDALKKLKNVYDFLSVQGFFGVEGRSVSFWSGAEAKKKAKEEYQKTGELSDAEVPALVVLFNIVSIFEKEFYMPLSANSGLSDAYKNLAVILPDALSRLYASESEGEANVYISSDKSSEPAALTMGNNFWNAELQTLQRREKPAPIWIHLHNPHSADPWGHKIDFNDPKSLEKLRVNRKLPYSPKHASVEQLIDKDPKQFRKSVMTTEEYGLWKEYPNAQQGVSLATLKKAARAIKKEAASRVAAKKSILALTPLSLSRSDSIGSIASTSDIDSPRASINQAFNEPFEPPVLPSSTYSQPPNPTEPTEPKPETEAEAEQLSKPKPY